MVPELEWVDALLNDAIRKEGPAGEETSQLAYMDVCLQMHNLAGSRSSTHRTLDANLTQRGTIREASFSPHLQQLTKAVETCTSPQQLGRREIRASRLVVPV
jgi:hypothetical protein